MIAPNRLSDQAGRLFDGQTMKLGFTTWFKGEVTLSHTSDRAVHARLTGGREVRLAIEAGRLLASCTCLEGESPPTCRHVWATLLETDRRGGLDGLRATPRPLAVDRLVDAPVTGTKATRRKKPTPRTRKRKRKNAKGKARDRPESHRQRRAEPARLTRDGV